MKTVIKSIAGNRVMAQFDDISGDRIEVEFHAPAEGGYVRAGSQQVCEKLGTRGSTLMWSGKALLIDLIRREYRAMRRAESKI